jgi:hypothetical protein
MLWVRIELCTSTLDLRISDGSFRCRIEGPASRSDFLFAGRLCDSQMEVSRSGSKSSVPGCVLRFLIEVFASALNRSFANRTTSSLAELSVLRLNFSLPGLSFIFPAKESGCWLVEGTFLSFCFCAT